MNARKVIRFCQIGLLACVGASIVLGLLAAFGFALDLNKNDKQNIWMAIGDRDEAAFTISSATFSVVANTGTLTMQTAASATIATVKLYGTTDTTVIYGLVDTTAAAFTQGTECRVKFIYTIDTETKTEYVPLKIW